MTRMAICFAGLLLLLPLCARAEVRLVAPETAPIGQAFRIAVEADAPASHLAITWWGKRLPLTLPKVGGGYRQELLLGTDVLRAEPGPAELTLEFADKGGVRSIERKITLTTVAYPEQRLTLPAEQVNPPASLAARLKKESEAMQKALAAKTPERLYALPLVRPVSGKVTSDYGLTRILNGEPRQPHRGLDLRGAVGTPVHAAAAGRVALVGNFYYAGRCVFIDHGLGMVSQYFHLSAADVREGQEVAAGEVIGKVGATGRATGPHLHFGLAILSQNIDPAPLCEAGQAAGPASGGQ